MQHMIEAALEEVGDVLIIQAVEHLAPLFAGAHQPHLAQGAELVGDGRLADPHQLCQGADVDLAVRQDGDDAHPRGIAEGLEQFGHFSRRAIIKGQALVLFVQNITPECVFIYAVILWIIIRPVKGTKVIGLAGNQTWACQIVET